jgi:crotonobetainyl-CoA:carnitine CoA-transferase CaiB-like acyl-CoA transferase
VNIAVQNEGQWRRLCERVLGRPDLVDDPRFLTNESRARYRDGLEEIIEVQLGALSRERVLRLLEEADVPHGSVNDPSDLLAHPQLAARTRWRAIQTEGGSVRAPAHPLNIVGLDRPGAKLPALDEHGDEVRRGKAWKVASR